MHIRPLNLFLSLLTLGAASLFAKKPNIVLIMADDVSWEAFGAYGSKEYKTPVLDRLASEGVKFNHCYSTPICTPSRVMIMTGQYNFRNYTHFGYLNPADKTFGHLMQENGYKTAIAGKWQLNGLYNKDTFLDHADNTRPFKAGFDEYSLWQLTLGKQLKEGGERFWSPTIEQNGEILSMQENAGKYGPDIMSEFLLDFMERHKDEPFFIYYPSVLVHDPFVHTPDTIGDLPRDQSANKQPKNKAEIKKHFVSMVEYMDTIVGRFVEKLEKIGQLENTLILFTADNGTHKSITSEWMGQEIKGGKGTTTDMGNHVPLIAYWKGKALNGAEINDLVDFTDFYPTIADLAGIELGENDPSDGQSFLPQILGEDTTPRSWILQTYHPYWGKRLNSTLFTRTADFKLYHTGAFYEVPEDLYEEHDLSGNLESEKLIKIHKDLQSVLDQLPEIPLDVARGAKHRPTYPNWKLPAQ